MITLVNDFVRNAQCNFLLLLLCINCGVLHSQKSVDLFCFGHSLIDHRPPAIPTPSDETTIIHWIHDIAAFKGYTFKAGGQYGFLTSHDNLPPFSQWGYDNVPGAWDSDVEDFSETEINTILITPANFIQYQSPLLPHPLDESTTVTEATKNIFEWVKMQKPDAKLFIYANWPEMDLANAFPPNIPSDSEITSYHDWTANSFMDWWIEYQDAMLEINPNWNTRMIPVGAVISQIITDVIPGEIPFDELYEDSAPHGRASLYFLAGMITYMAIYEERLPENYIPDAIVHEGIINNLTEINTFAWNALNNFNFSSDQSRVFCSEITNVSENISENKKRLRIYPIPNDGNFTITKTLDINNFDLIDIHGNVLDNITQNETRFDYDFNQLSDGVYFIRYQLDGQLYFEKIILVK